MLAGMVGDISILGQSASSWWARGTSMQQDECWAEEAAGSTCS